MRRCFIGGCQNRNVRPWQQKRENAKAPRNARFALAATSLRRPCLADPFRPRPPVYPHAHDLGVAWRLGVSTVLLAIAEDGWHEVMRLAPPNARNRCLGARTSRHALRPANPGLPGNQTWRSEWDPGMSRLTWTGIFDLNRSTPPSAVWSDLSARTPCTASPMSATPRQNAFAKARPEAAKPHAFPRAQAGLALTGPDRIPPYAGFNRNAFSGSSA
jgi:hypothetical protein